MNELEPCYYCGQIATTIDHVPPKVYRPFIIADRELSKRYPFKEVPCCRECNCSILGSKYWTLYERKLFIKKRLAEKYRKILNTPMCSDSDLAQFGFTLQSLIIQRMALRELIEKRLAW
jgi:hypothetical protein